MIMYVFWWCFWRIFLFCYRLKCLHACILLIRWFCASLTHVFSRHTFVVLNKMEGILSSAFAEQGKANKSHGLSDKVGRKELEVSIWSLLERSSSAQRRLLRFCRARKLWRRSGRTSTPNRNRYWRRYARSYLTPPSRTISNKNMT